MLNLFLKTLPFKLTSSVVFALVILIFKITWLNTIPEIFAYGYELGIVTETLLTSYVASYIFYLAVVHFKEVKERYDFYPYALKFSKVITTTCKTELSHFTSESGIKLEFESLNANDLSKSFSKIDPYKNNASIHFPVSHGMEAGDWIDYLKSNCEHIVHNISKIIDSRTHIDPEWLNLLIAIEESGFISFVRGLHKSNLPGHLPGSPFQNNGNMYFDYYEKCLALNNYIKKVEVVLSR